MKFGSNKFVVITETYKINYLKNPCFQNAKQSNWSHLFFKKPYLSYVLKFASVVQTEKKYIYLIDERIFRVGINHEQNCSILEKCLELLCLYRISNFSMLWFS